MEYASASDVSTPYPISSSERRVIKLIGLFEPPIAGVISSVWKTISLQCPSTEPWPKPLDNCAGVRPWKDPSSTGMSSVVPLNTWYSARAPCPIYRGELNGSIGWLNGNTSSTTRSGIPIDPAPVHSVPSPRTYRDKSKRTTCLRGLRGTIMNELT